jgi:hypothetical protein
VIANRDTASGQTWDLWMHVHLLTGVKTDLWMLVHPQADAGSLT